MKLIKCLKRDDWVDIVCNFKRPCLLHCEVSRDTESYLMSYKFYKNCIKDFISLR